MEDRDIIAMFYARCEDAIAETGKKYGALLMNIALNVLGDRFTAEECVSDTYLRAWDTIPPEKPEVFSAYLAKIVKNRSIDAYRRNHSEKRKKTSFAESFEELSELVSGKESTESEVDGKLLSEAIDRYLREIPEERRRVFILRYFYCDPLKKIGRDMDITVPKLKSMLFRERAALRDYLEEEGFNI